MIIRETDQTFILIEQHEHARMSAEFMRYLKPHYFINETYTDSVLFAIEQHDCGWKLFDRQPFWNDKKQAPYSFIDFPLLPKLVLYEQGIDQVERKDPYAALLCSEHYTRFVKKHDVDEVKQYVKTEHVRFKRIVDRLPNFNKDLFTMHYSLLQFADNLSLFICLSEPGATQEHIHPFFRSGIPTPSAFQDLSEKHIQVEWQNNHTIVLRKFPFTRPIQVTLSYKVVLKSDIAMNGLIETYVKTPNKTLDINIQSI